MSKVFETGHAKNVANLEKLISYCQSYGERYNPGSENIHLKNLDDLLAQSQQAMKRTDEAKTQFNNASNERNIVFSDNKTLSTRILNAFIAFGTNELYIKTLQGINRKIQGKRAKPKSNDKDENGNPTDDKTISVSQQSFDSVLNFYQSLLELLTAEPLYKPNEEALSLTGLQLKISEMQAANSAVIKATVSLSGARIHRNKTLYEPKNGLLQISKNVKKYIKSVFGANSEEVSQVNMLVFVDKDGK
jgi:hypothetical protein